MIRFNLGHVTVIPFIQREEASIAGSNDDSPYVELIREPIQPVNGD